MTIQELFKTIYDRSPAWREWGPRTIQNVVTWNKDDFNRRGFLAEPGIHKVFPVTEDQIMVSTAKPPTDGYLQLHFYAIPVSWLELTEEQVIAKLEEKNLPHRRSPLEREIRTNSMLSRKGNTRSKRLLKPEPRMKQA